MTLIKLSRSFFITYRFMYNFDNDKIYIIDSCRNLKSWYNISNARYLITMKRKSRNTGSYREKLVGGKFQNHISKVALELV